LLAENDVPVVYNNDSAINARVSNSEHNDFDFSAAQRLHDDETLSSLPRLLTTMSHTDNWSVNHYGAGNNRNENVVIIPFRAPWDCVSENETLTKFRNGVTEATAQIANATQAGNTLTGISFNETLFAYENEAKKNETLFEDQKKIEETKSPKSSMENSKLAVDYASKSAGALILEKSPNFQGTSNLLNADQDKYAIVPCDEPQKYVVIGLSEDILVKQVILANYERYSSRVKEFALQGSTTAVGDWVEIGRFEAKEGNGKQVFPLERPAWVRYLKFHFLSHHGDEHYCTISQISLHGSTVLQGFHEHWEEDNKENDEVTENANENNDTQMGHSAVGDTILLNQTEEARKVQSSSYFAAKSFKERMAVFSNENLTDNALSSASFVLLSSQSQSTGCKRELKTVPYKVSFSSETYLCDASRFSSVLADHSGNSSLSCNLCRLSECDVRKDLSCSAGVQWKNPIARSHIKMNLPEVARKMPEQLQKNESLTRELPSTSSSPATSAAPSSSSSETGKGSDSEKNNASLESQQGQNQNTFKSINDDQLVGKGKQTSHSALDAKPDLVTAETVSDSTIKDDYQDQMTASLASLLSRLPSAKCLDNLDFTNFRMNHLKGRTQQTGAGNGNSGGSNPTATVPMEPIFKKLTDEIRALHASVAVHDQFAKETASCYQRVLLELMTESDSMRLEQEARLRRLEMDIEGGIAYVIAVKRIFFWALPYVISLALPAAKLVFWEDMGVAISFCRLTLLSTAIFALFYLCAHSMLASSGWRLLWQRRKTTALKVVVSGSIAGSFDSSDTWSHSQQNGRSNETPEKSAVPSTVPTIVPIRT